MVALVDQDVRREMQSNVKNKKKRLVCLVFVCYEYHFSKKQDAALGDRVAM